MAAHITLTCDACGREQDIYNRTSTDNAISAALGMHGWQQITYDYGGVDLTELRCPDCHLTPLFLPKGDTIITREPAESYA